MELTRKQEKTDGKHDPYMNFMTVYWKVINVYENEKVEQGKVDWKYNVYVGGHGEVGAGWYIRRWFE